MGVFEENVGDRLGGFRPPRNVMKGGLARAAMAGQQSVDAAIAGGSTGGQARNAISPEMLSLTESLRQTQMQQNAGEAFTKLRTLAYVDSAKDQEAKQDAYWNEMNRPQWDEAIVQGAAIANLLNGIAGLVADSGTQVTETEKTLTKPVEKTGVFPTGENIPVLKGMRGSDQLPMAGDGLIPKQETVPGYREIKWTEQEPVIGVDGKPITYKEKTITKSPAAIRAEKLQNTLSKLFPNMAEANKTKRQSKLDDIEVFNLSQQTSAQTRLGLVTEMESNKMNLKQAEDLRDFYVKQSRQEGANTERLLALIDEQSAKIAELKTRSGMPGLALPDTVYSPILAAVEPGEAGKWGINAYNQNMGGGNYDGGDIRNAAWNTERKPAEEFTLGEIKKLQADGKIFAFGFMQIKPDTLMAVVKKIGLSDDTKMNLEGQMKIAEGIFELDWRKPIKNYITAENPTDEQLFLAADEIPKEWSSVKTRRVPGDKRRTGLSYYADNGVDVASIEYMTAVEAVKKARERYLMLMKMGASNE